MLLFLVAIVRKDVLELLIVRRIDTLVVPVDRLEFFHDRHDRAVAVDCRRMQLLGAFVE